MTPFELLRADPTFQKAVDRMVGIFEQELAENLGSVDAAEYVLSLLLLEFSHKPPVGPTEAIGIAIFWAEILRRLSLLVPRSTETESSK